MTKRKSAVPVTYEVADNICQISLNRPDVRNAQSRQLLEALDAAFVRATNDPLARVIILRGAGEHFSAGHDLGTADELADRERRPLEDGLRGRYAHSRELFVDLTLRWRAVPKPTIAVVQGYCIFGGWMIASAMDLIFAADDAMFLASNFQYFSLPWDVHPRKAKEMLFQGRFIDGREAVALGLVNHAYPGAEVLTRALDYAADVAANDPFQLRMMKLAVNQMQDSQGFHAHITAAHHMHLLSSTAERDPGFALSVPARKRRPMVQRSLDNYSKARGGAATRADTSPRAGRATRGATTGPGTPPRR